MCLVSGAHQLWDETWELLPSLCCICTDIFRKNRDSACLIPKKPLKNSKNLPVFGVSFSQGHSGGGGPRQQVAWALLLALLALDPGQLPLRKGVALLAAVRKVQNLRYCFGCIPQSFLRRQSLSSLCFFPEPDPSHSSLSVGNHVWFPLCII